MCTSFKSSEDSSAPGGSWPVNFRSGSRGGGGPKPSQGVGISRRRRPAFARDPAIRSHVGSGPLTWLPGWAAGPAGPPARPPELCPARTRYASGGPPGVAPRGLMAPRGAGWIPARPGPPPFSPTVLQYEAYLCCLVFLAPTVPAAAPHADEAATPICRALVEVQRASNPALP